MASIEAIAAGLVHEIRNPLVAVKTFSQLLPTKYHDPDFRETFSRTAGREIRRIDNLLTRFRTLVSASSQPIESVDVIDPIRHPHFSGPSSTSVRSGSGADGAPRSIPGNTACWSSFSTWLKCHGSMGLAASTLRSRPHRGRHDFARQCPTPATGFLRSSWPRSSTHSSRPRRAAAVLALRSAEGSPTLTAPVSALGTMASGPGARSR